MFGLRSAASTKKFKVGTVIIECDGSRSIKVAEGKWAEFYLGGEVDEFSFPARQIAFPARLATPEESSKNWRGGLTDW